MYCRWTEYRSVYPLIYSPAIERSMLVSRFGSPCCVTVTAAVADAVGSLVSSLFLLGLGAVLMYISSYLAVHMYVVYTYVHA